MAIYFSTFISGMQEFIPRLLNKGLGNFETVKLLDGAILYQTSSNIEEIRKLRFFNNSFQVINQFENPRDIDEMIFESIENKEVGGKIASILKQSQLGRTFRIITSKENQLISADKKLIGKMEERITRQRLKVDRSAPDIEFWFLQRSEGIGFFMIRLTKHRAYEKVLQKGELRPELSNIAVMISEPVKEDVVIDPFCGHGSFVLERARYPHKQMIAIDNDPKNIFELRRKIKGKKSRIERSDSLDLEKIPGKSVDKIITDPPWGLFKKIDYVRFYERMISQFSRVIKKNGIIVLLTAQKELAERLLSKDNSLKIEKRFDILVSGKKAAIYKIRKIQ